MIIHLLYTTLSGNTRHMVQQLSKYATQMGHYAFEPIEISDATPDLDETSPFFAFVPTYLDGGNGIDNGVREILTNALGDYLTFNENSKYLLGIIGSGNKNFNAQYILTARRYAVKFHTPVIANFELRGTSRDVAYVYNNIVKRLQEAGY